MTPGLHLGLYGEVHIAKGRFSLRALAWDLVRRLDELQKDGHLFWNTDAGKYVFKGSQDGLPAVVDGLFTLRRLSNRYGPQSAQTHNENSIIRIYD